MRSFANEMPQAWLRRDGAARNEKPAARGDGLRRRDEARRGHYKDSTTISLVKAGNRKNRFVPSRVASDWHAPALQVLNAFKLGPVP
jgi:hypothetical protein